MQKQLSPIKGNCQTENNLYKNTVATQGNHQILYETSEGEFEWQFNNNNSSNMNEVIKTVSNFFFS